MAYQSFKRKCEHFSPIFKANPSFPILGPLSSIPFIDNMASPKRKCSERETGKRISSHLSEQNYQSMFLFIENVTPINGDKIIGKHRRPAS